ncbi:MAG: hypothetical protein RL726_382, partial [Actinomycetota bacterium]
MPRHVIVDGSNVATEGRSKPSLKQLNEAVMAFMADHPKDVITVIVDATFGHRIDAKESKAFDKAVEHNELVTPPAGTVGRGDGFVLSIAQKVGASILSNDSYQEFHGQYPWLFDEGRLIGGKPVPNVGWVFVNRTPVRGDKSRRSIRDAEKGGKKDSTPKAKVSAEAMKPMPVPKAPPPGATLPAKKTSAAPAGKTVNEVLPFLQFVEKHGIGSVVDGVVDSYSSHGAYVVIGDVRGYVPLRLYSSPPPRSAREVMKLGDTITLEVVEIIPGRRSIDLKPSTRKASSAKASTVKKSTAKKVAAPKKSAPAKASTAKKVADPKKSVAPKKSAPVKVTAVKKSVAPKKAATAKKVAAPKKSVAPKKAAPKKAAPKKSVAK